MVVLPLFGSLGERAGLLCKPISAPFRVSFWFNQLEDEHYFLPVGPASSIPFLRPQMVYIFGSNRMTEGDEMTISESNLANWLDGLPDDELSARRQIAEQRRARAEQALARLNADVRKIDTRRKIVVGGAVMTIARRDDRFRGLLFEALNATVTTPRDRAILGLPPLPSDPKEESLHV